MEEFHRKIRSFVRREGRMTAGQAQAYEELMPKYGFEFERKLLNFAELFGNENPITLEIGFGMGASLAEQAKLNPERNFLGIEVHRPGVGALLSRIKENGATNVRVIAFDAVEVLAQMIGEHTLDRVQLFFPDPWPKKRHHKRRIVKPEFVQRLQSKLKVGGIFHMATDWENYAEHMLEVMLAEQGWKNLSSSNDYVPKPDDRPVTKFQARGERLGHGVWDLMFEKLMPEKEEK